MKSGCHCCPPTQLRVQVEINPQPEKATDLITNNQLPDKQDLSSDFCPKKYRKKCMDLV